MSEQSASREANGRSRGVDEVPEPKVGRNATLSDAAIRLVESIEQIQGDEKHYRELSIQQAEQIKALNALLENSEADNRGLRIRCELALEGAARIAQSSAQIRATAEEAEDLYHNLQARMNGGQAKGFAAIHADNIEEEFAKVGEAVREIGGAVR